MKLLLNKGADARVLDDKQWSPLYHASKDSNLDIVVLLLFTQFQLEFPEIQKVQLRVVNCFPLEKSRVPLSLFYYQGSSSEMVDVLLQHICSGRYLFALLPEGKPSVLCAACRGGKIDIAELYVQMYRGETQIVGYIC